MPRATALLLAAALLTGACSSSRPAATSLTPSASPSVSSPLARKKLDLQCTGPQATLVKEVALGNVGRDLYVAWSGSGEAQMGSTFVVAATITDPGTGASRTVARKAFTHGQPPVQYVFDPATGKTRYVAVDKQEEPALYPDALQGMGPGWTATATAEIDGVTVADCRLP